jgi:hypothetical protein
MKFHDSGRASAALATAWTTGELDPTTDNCLNGIATGTGESEHLGRRYRIREVTLKCQVNLPAVTAAAAPEDAAVIAIALVLDTQTNGAQLEAEDVYTAVISNSMPVRNLQYKDRFRVLKMWNFVMPNGAFSAGSSATLGISNGATKLLTVTKKVNIPVTVKSTGSTVADITDNSLHVIGTCSKTDAKILYNSRIRYTEG